MRRAPDAADQLTEPSWGRVGWAGGGECVVGAAGGAPFRQSGQDGTMTGRLTGAGHAAAQIHRSVC